MLNTILLIRGGTSTCSKEIFKFSVTDHTDGAFPEAYFQEGFLGLFPLERDDSIALFKIYVGMRRN
jgi:hypothetical protein